MIEALCISQNIKTNLTIDDFNIVDHCGENSWGTVCKIIESSTNQPYSAIIINKNELTIDKHNQIIEQIQHYINVSFYPYINSLEAIFEWDQYVFIIYEYHEINLARLCGNKSYWNEIDIEQKIGVFSNIAFAVNTCHKKNIIHFNVRMENIDINTVGCACLFNFSQCLEIASSRSSSIDVLIYPPPPEAAQSPGVYTTAVDCWALGLLLYELIIDIDDSNRFFESETGPKFHFDLLPDQLLPISRGLLENDPEKRWNIDKLLEYLSYIGY